MLILHHRLVQLGKFGSFPSSQLLGLHYDITYEIAPSSEPGGGGESSSPAPGITTGEEETVGRSERSERSFGQAKGKKRKNNAGKGKDVDAETGGDGKVNPGWKNLLRPLRRQPLVDAVIGMSSPRFRTSLHRALGISRLSPLQAGLDHV
jgi:tRNA (adenine-N(1)-)-methyltransferase non-catalytic subunit